jgi:hypothetical protein
MSVADEIVILAEKIKKCEDRKIVIDRTIDKYFEKIAELKDKKK